MSRIFLQIILPIFFVLELLDENVREPALTKLDPGARY